MPCFDLEFDVPTVGLTPLKVFREALLIVFSTLGTVGVLDWVAAGVVLVNEPDSHSLASMIYQPLVLVLSIMLSLGAGYAAWRIQSPLPEIPQWSATDNACHMSRHSKSSPDMLQVVDSRWPQ